MKSSSRSLRRGRQESERQDSIVDAPATRREHRARSRAEADRRGDADGTSGGRGNRRGQGAPIKRREHANGTTAIENRGPSPTHSTRNTWPRAEAEEPRLQRRQPRTAAEKAIRVGSSTRRQGADPKSSTSGQRQNDGATHRKTTADRRRTTRWTAQPVTQDEPENAIRREPPATPLASPVTATETPARRTPKTAGERPREDP